MSVRAFNAMTAGAALGDHIIESAGPRDAARARRSIRMSARTPAIVLGGTGYVAGELLRLLASHPHFDLARSPRTASPASRSRSSSGTCSPCCRTCASRATTRSSSTSRRTRRPPSSRRRRTACRPALIDRLLAAAEQAGTQAARRRHLGGLPLRERGRLRGGLQARARRAGPLARVHLRGARAPERAAHAARGASRLLRDRGAARERAAAVARPRRAAPVRVRRHRQHRLGPPARGRHAPSAAPQRPVRVQRARAPARAGDHGARAGGLRRRRPTSLSCRTPARSRAAST